MELNGVCRALAAHARGARARAAGRAGLMGARRARPHIVCFAAAGRAALAALAVALGGCMLSPGMSFSGMPSGGGAQVSAAGNMGNAVGNAAGNAAGTAADGARVPGSVAGTDGAPPGSLVEITRELVEKQRSERPTGVPADVRELFAKAAPYQIGPGDILGIVVWDHPELNMPGTGGASGADTSGASSVAPGYTVDTNGFIQYAYIGPVKVSGLTEMGVRDLLADKLSRYVRQPQVTVRIETYRSKRVYLDGELRTPGVQVLNDMPMTLPEAINRAGGFTEKADRSRVAVTRGDETAMVDMPDMIRKGLNPDRIILRDGDLVRVFAQADSKVFVIGEVQRPGGVMFNNGHMTLNQALGDAGGISQVSGDASQVYVVRGRDVGKPVVYHLDASSAASMATADAFDLRPNDVVFVDASALVKWSRVIGLILPATQAAATSRAVGY